MSTFEGCFFVPVSTKFSMRAFSPKMMYLKPLIFSRFLINWSIEPSLLVSSTCRYCFQKSSLRIMAFTSFTSFFLPLKSCFGNSSKAKSVMRVLRITAKVCRKLASLISVNISSTVSTHSPLGSWRNSWVICMFSTKFTSLFLGMVISQRFTCHELSARIYRSPRNPKSCWLLGRKCRWKHLSLSTISVSSI